DKAPTASDCRPLRCVCSDSSVPHKPSLEGFKFWTSFICSDTRQILAILHRTKAEVQNLWIYTAKTQQKKTLSDIITFKRDGAGELGSKSVVQFLIDEGIVDRVTEPHNPTTNP